MDLKEAVNTLIRTRRAMYTNMFSGEVVDDHIIEEMLENAHWAPSHKHTLPWRFSVFKGEGLKSLGEFQGELYVQKSGDDFNEQKLQKLKQKPMACSHVIAIGMKRDEKERVPEVEEICAVACAVQNMWLTASAHRIGCYWSTGGVTYEEDAKQFFGLDEKDKLLGFLYIGMPQTDRWPEGKRTGSEAHVKWFR